MVKKTVLLLFIVTFSLSLKSQINEDIVGVWKYSKLMDTNHLNESDFIEKIENFSSILIELKEDGTFESEIFDFSDNGKWSLDNDGDRNYLKLNGNESLSLLVDEFSTSSFVVTIDNTKVKLSKKKEEEKILIEEEDDDWEEEDE